MAFGRMGSLGRGFGAFGSLGGTAGGGSSLLALNSRVVFLGNSKEANQGTRSNSSWAMARTDGRYYFHPYALQARGGDSTTDYLNRIAASIAIAPHVAVIGDTTNDHAGGNSLATIQSNINAIITAFRAIGCRVILQTTPAMASVTGGNETIRQGYNSWIATLAADDIGIADVAAVIDTTNAAHSYDGTHYTARGAYLASGPVADILNSWMVTDNVLATLPLDAVSGFGANLNTEWDMGGTTGTVGTNMTGTVYTGGNSQNAAGVTAVLKAADDTGGETLRGQKAQRLDVTGTSSSSTGDVRIYRTQNITLTPGDFYEVIANVKVTDTDGVSAPTNLRGFHLQLGSLGFIFIETIDASSGVIDFVVDQVLRTRPVPLTTTGASAAAELSTRYTSGESPDVRLLKSGLQIRKTELVAYAAPYNQNIPGDGGGVLFGAPSATPASGAAGSVFTSTPGHVSGGGCDISYQWKKASDNSNVGVGTGETTRQWTSTGAPAGSYYCAVTWTNSMGVVTINSNNVTVS